MLHALMDGRALTASELARVAGVTPQTASEHLAKLAAADLVQVEKQGRHRYHRLATPAVAQMLESIMQVASRLEAMRPALATVRELLRQSDTSEVELAARGRSR
jgi:DNA-binding transcriptional ArsR family regulator